MSPILQPHKQNTHPQTTTSNSTEATKMERKRNKYKMRECCKHCTICKTNRNSYVQVSCWQMSWKYSYQEKFMACMCSGRSLLEHLKVTQSHGTDTSKQSQHVPSLLQTFQTIGLCDCARIIFLLHPVSFSCWLFHEMEATVSSKCAISRAAITRASIHVTYRLYVQNNASIFQNCITKNRRPDKMPVSCTEFRCVAKLKTTKGGEKKRRL